MIDFRSAFFATMIYLKRILLFVFGALFLPLILIFFVVVNDYFTILNPSFYDTQIVSVAYSDTANVVFESLEKDVPAVKQYLPQSEFEDLFASAFPQDAVLSSWKFFIENLRNVNFKISEGFEGLTLDILFVQEGFKSLSLDISKLLLVRMPQCEVSAEDEIYYSTDCLKPELSADFYQTQINKEIENSFTRLVPSAIDVLRLEPSQNPGVLFNDFSFPRLILILSITFAVAILLMVLLSWGNFKFALIFFGSYAVTLGALLLLVRRILMLSVDDLLPAKGALLQWKNVIFEIAEKSLQNLNYFVFALVVAGIILLAFGAYWKVDRKQV